jgi:hypothetical protein
VFGLTKLTYRRECQLNDVKNITTTQCHMSTRTDIQFYTTFLTKQKVSRIVYVPFGRGEAGVMTRFVSRILRWLKASTVSIVHDVIFLMTLGFKVSYVSMFLPDQKAFRRKTACETLVKAQII